MKVENRILEYDILRILAITAVIMIHCSAPYVIYYDIASIQFVFGNFLDTISRIGVPFFLMISGTFMLNEHKELSNTKLKNKLLKIFFILICWSSFYALVYNFHNFSKSFIYGHYHLWYLYLIIGLYGITPILRLFIKEKNKKYIYYFIILSIIFYFLPNTLNNCFVKNDSILRLSNMFHMNFVSGYTTYYIAGWLINEEYVKLKKYKNLFLFLSFFTMSAIFCGTQFYHPNNIKLHDYFYNNNNILVFLYSISSFIFVRLLADEYKNKLTPIAKKIIIKLSKLTFGVYLVHASVLHLAESIIRHHPVTFPLSIIIAFIFTYPLSFSITFIISKIKYLKELIQI